MAARDSIRSTRNRERPRPTEPWPAEESMEAPAPAPAAAPSGTRDDIVSVAGLNVLAGIWLIISPWVVNYQSGDARWNPIVFGAIVAVLAFGQIMMPARTMALSAINAAIGVWLFISGFWLADSGQASWNLWILGVIVFVLALSGLAAGNGRRSTAP